MAIGSVWGEGTWADPTWTEDSWAGAQEDLGPSPGAWVEPTRRAWIPGFVAVDIIPEAEAE